MAEHTELDDGLWLSVTELAAKKGVGKSTISEKVGRLVEAGRLTVKPGAGKQKLINLAEYDTAIGAVGDGAREQGAATKAADRPGATDAPKLPPDGRLRDEQTRDKAYAADLKFIELERARGNLLAVADFDPLAEDAASRIGDIVDGLLARDSELTAIAVKEGENGMRAALKRIARAQRIAIVTAMKDMAIAARARAASAASGLPMLQADLLPDDDPVQANGV
jgi:hypothetical protein